MMKLTAAVLILFMTACSDRPSEGGGVPPKEESGKPTEGGGVPPKEVPDTRSPGFIAAEILKAYKAKDLESLSRHSTSDNRKMFSKLKPGSSRYESIFNPKKWRMRAVMDWDGKTLSVRLKGDQARCMFHDMGTGEVALVVLNREGGEWRFEDINSPDRETWETWGEPK